MSFIDSEFIIYHISDQEFHIIFNRSEKRNALNKEMRKSLLSFFNTYCGDNRRLLFSGRGTCFCAGLDIKEDLKEQDLLDFAQIISKLRLYNGPSTAKISGAVRGGGLILARSCKQVISKASADFAIPKPNFSDNPHVIKTLKNYISENQIFQQISDDDHPWSAQEALTKGLIDEIS